MRPMAGEEGMRVRETYVERKIAFADYRTEGKERYGLCAQAFIYLCPYDERDSKLGGNTGRTPELETINVCVSLCVVP